MSVPLEGRVAVLSPHLDDWALSIGAGLAAAATRGADVSAITVLAGDPRSDRPAGRWDAAAGFRTEGQASEARREEDRRACDVLGVRPQWLPFADRDYAARADSEEVWKAIIGAIGEADIVLVPGFPLVHPDHEWLARLMMGLPPPVQLLLYVEQPYAMNRRRLGPPRPPASIADLVEGELSWTPLPSGAEHRRAKRSAIRAYKSQRGLISRRPFLAERLSIYEARRGGELVAWTSTRNHRS
jgi:LmbE family N-acetylglucosaminyl deacetylase